MKLPKHISDEFDEKFNHDNPFGVAVVIIEVDQHGISTQRPGQHDLKNWFATTLENEVKKAVEARDVVWIDAIEKKWDEAGMEQLTYFHFNQVVESLSHNKEEV